MSFEVEELSFEPPVPLPLGDIAQATHEIRNAPLERLADANWLENWLLLRLGLNNEMLHEFPQSLLPWCGHGVMSWQYPRQFSKYLVWLSQRKIGNYIEIGARRGGTFIITVEYLRRFNPIENALALDIVEQPIMRAYAESAQGCSYVILDSKSVAAKKLLQSRYWDLALIDGDHSASGFWNDFAVLRDHARIIAAHDVASDLFPHLKQFQSALVRLLPTRKVFSALDQYDEVKARTGKAFLGLVAAELG
jgi:hypothetical protein